MKVYTTIDKTPAITETYRKVYTTKDIKKKKQSQKHIGRSTLLKIKTPQSHTYMKVYTTKDKTPHSQKHI